VSGAPPLLIDNPWLAIAASLGAFAALFASVQLLAYTRLVSSEGTRKVVHAGSGLLTLAFPFLFRDVWPVAVLTATSAALLAAAKFVPSLRRSVGQAVSGVHRTTLGRSTFPSRSSGSSG
jgi:phytol kinase